MSFVASSIGVPARNSIVIMETFSRLLDVMCLSLSIPLSVFSRVFERFVSMSSALAPGYEVMIMTFVVSVLGISSMASRDREKSPNTAIAT